MNMTIPKLTHAFFLTVDGIDPISAGLTAERIGVEPLMVDQFDLRRTPQEELADLVDYAAFRIRYKSIPTPSEIGCALAHRYCWSTLLEDAGDVALIFEDDAILSDCDTDFLARLMRAVPSWDLINLHITYGAFSRKHVSIAPGIDAYRATVSCFGSHAYLINRTGAAHFLSRQTPLIRNYADWPDEVWNLRMWGIKGGPVNLRDRPSTLGRHPSAPDTHLVERLVHAGRSLHFRLRSSYRRRIRGDVNF